MNDNVIKFRKIEKKPDKPEPKRPLPNWWPFAALVLVAIAIYFYRHAGFPA